MNSPTYELIGDDEAPGNRLVVCVYLGAAERKKLSDERLTARAALELHPHRFQPMAKISWSTQIGPKGMLLADKIEGLPAEEALKLAEGLRESLALGSTVVRLQDRALWREEWGRLLANKRPKRIPLRRIK